MNAEIEYEQFISWAYAQGLDFPCTAAEFYVRAAEYAAGDDELIDRLCQQAIGPDWRE